MHQRLSYLSIHRSRLSTSSPSCALSSTRGCTHVMLAVRSTSSIVPRTRPKLKAFIKIHSTYNNTHHNHITSSNDIDNHTNEHSKAQLRRSYAPDPAPCASDWQYHQRRWFVHATVSQTQGSSHTAAPPSASGPPGTRPARALPRTDPGGCL